jgi:hypothetical protein
LAWTTRNVVAPPRLVTVEGLPLFETFEPKNSNSKTVRTSAGNGVIRIGSQGDRTWFEISNGGVARRLSTSVSFPDSLARFPFVAISHRAGPMTNISVNVGNDVGRISESHVSGPNVAAMPFRQDDTWQSFVMAPVLAIRGGEWNPDNLLVKYFRLASAAKTDQTGLYEPWLVDHLMVTPAVRAGNQLSLTPKFVSTEPIVRIEMAELAGLAPWGERSDAERSAVAWRTVEPGSPLPVAFDELPDGVVRILVRAVDRDGRTSRITEIPIMLDRKAPLAKALHRVSTLPDAPGFLLELRVPVESGSPIDDSGLTLALNGESLEIPKGAVLFSRSAAQLTLQINWPALLAGRPLPPSPSLAISGMKDGAGNPVPLLEVPLSLSEDIVPRPLILSVDRPDSVLRMPEGIVFGDEDVPYKVDKKIVAKLVRTAEAPPYVQVVPKASLSEITLAPGMTEDSRGVYMVCEVRFPKTKEGDAGRLYAEIYDGKKIVVAANEAAAKAQADLDKIPRPLTEVADKWQTVVIPVGDLLKGTKSEKWSVGISRTGVRKRQMMEVRNWRTEAPDDGGAQRLGCALVVR